MAIPTAVWQIDPTAPDETTIRRAAELLRAGGLVAFPTETVYGLGANAQDEAAVRKVFAAKGRPASNPLIVHLADVRQIGDVAATWPDVAKKLAAAFWPGPLTIVVARAAGVPDIITGGGPTVAVRCPNHPVAAALLRAAAIPVAAPSANRSTELSPTRAEHVLKGLAGRIDAVLDGGPCPGGIESTVVDATGELVTLLRPGPVTLPMLEAVVGRVEVNRSLHPPTSTARSPGQHAKHYSPRTPIRLVHGIDIFDELDRAIAAGDRVKDLSLGGKDGMPNSPIGYAVELYSRLHDLDAAELNLILIELPPDTPEWAAVRDRLIRAAGLSERST